MDVEAFIYQGCGRAAKGAAAHADGEHFQVARDDNVGGFKQGAVAAEFYHAAQYAGDALQEVTVECLAEIHCRGAADVFRGGGGTAKAAHGYLRATLTQHGNATQHGRIGQIVYQI
ncbi:MAG: hypothetical protein EBV03_01850 [Proteobacteria bacterium]|nr:hypothetical protein [Pseudomonadota bacterium]